jgi:hypothetical protein
MTMTSMIPGRAWDVARRISDLLRWHENARL